MTRFRFNLARMAHRIHGVALVLTICGAATAHAQPTFSIDAQGPTFGVPNGFTAVPISPADILTTTPPGPFGPNPPILGPLPAPGTFIPGGPPGLGLGIPSYPIIANVDALSYGTDTLLRRNSPLTFFFSVDEFAFGLPGIPAPSVTTEGAAGAIEASADVFASAMPAPMVSHCPAGPVFGNVGVVDGNGLPSATPAVYPGVGLIEPNPPFPGLPDMGDNLDALDMDSTPNAAGLVYFSLDSGFLDPIEGPGANLGTALLNGFVGGDVLVSGPGGPPALYAAAAALGLGFGDVNDLDALILAENGDGLYTPSMVPFDWAIPGSMVDMLLFSVRRGSAIIGAPDGLCGVPISEGDILTTTAAGVPGIFIAAERLGLATMRAGLVGNDDLDGLDAVPEPGTLALLLAGAMSLPFARRRRVAAR